MKIAFIHSEKKIKTGAHYINDLISSKLRSKGIIVENFYPTANLIEAPINLKGIENILFFYSLLEHREKILKCDLIQGTTYTPLTFLSFKIPTISHFGSTTKGFLDVVPQFAKMNKESATIWNELKKSGVIEERDLKTKKPLLDIAEVEKLVGIRSNAVVATSQIVKHDLISQSVPQKKISIIHNAIEDYWFDSKPTGSVNNPHLVFLGRLGNDSFNLKLKGFDRLVMFYKRFPKVSKITLGITTNEKIREFLNSKIRNHYFMSNVAKDNITKYLNPLRGSILFIPSRYEGFSLSLIEGMSQGLIPIVSPVGVAPEIIRNGKNGFIANSITEAERFANKILLSKSLRQRLSENARITSENFSSDIMVNNFINLYEKVLGKKFIKSKPFSFRSFFKE